MLGVEDNRKLKALVGSEEQLSRSPTDWRYCGSVSVLDGPAESLSFPELKDMNYVEQ